MSGTIVALGGAVLVAALVGALLDRALFARGPRGLSERTGRALLFGLLVAGAVSMALDAAGVRVGPGSMGAALALIVAACAWTLRRRTTLPPAPPAPSWPHGGAALAHHGLLLFASVALLVPVIAGAVLPAFQLDSLARWLFKAKVLATEGTLRGALSTDPEFGFTHQRYPPLVAHVSNLPALLSGHWNERAAEGVYPWFAVALVLLLYGAVARRADRLRAALAAAWVASLPLLSFLPRPPPGAGAFSAMADVPLAAFAAAAGLALLDALDGVRDRAHLEAGLLLAGAALTKNEGLPLLFGAALAVLVGAPRARLRRMAGVVGLAGGLYLLLWWSLARRFPVLDEDYAGHFSLHAVLAGLPRLRFVLPAYAAELLSFQRWGLTWFAIAALLVLGRPRRPVAALLLLAGAQLVACALMFLISAWTSPAGAAIVAAGSGDPVEYLLSITLGRLFLQVAPLLIVLSCCSCPPLSGEAPAAR